MAEIIEFKCLKCQSVIKVNSQSAGQSGDCPKCGAVIQVPRPGKAKLELVGHKKRLTKKTKSHRRWVMLVFVSMFIIAFIAPAYTLGFGIFVVLLCTMAFIPRVQWVSHSMLRLNFKYKWRSGLRLFIYISIGLCLSLVGNMRLVHEREKATELKEKAAADEEEMYLEQQANKIVDGLINDAKIAWDNGDESRAIQKIDDAMRVVGARDFRAARTLRKEIANSQVQDLILEAKDALFVGEIEKAIQHLDASGEIKFASSRREAILILSQIEHSSDPEYIFEVLVGLSDDVFQQVLDNDLLPSELNTGYPVLDQQARAIIKEKMSDIVESRIEQVHKRLANKILREEAEKQAREAMLEKVRLEKEARRVEARKESLQAGFSSWNGSHIELSKLIKESMNDPGSYKHVKTEYWDNGDHLIVKTSFRGKNAFGGVVLNWVKAKATIDGRIVYIIEQGP